MSYVPKLGGDMPRVTTVIIIGSILPVMFLFAVIILPALAALKERDWPPVMNGALMLIFVMFVIVGICLGWGTV